MDEARAMLDALMGADRNTSLASKGMSASKKRTTTGGSYSRGGGASIASQSSAGSDMDAGLKRQKRSCYSANIDPYYTAWGVDMYELFTNTKSDLGTKNEFVVDEDAREEFKALPEEEKERLGYERMLHRKLGDLVRQVDRTVARSKEKLRQELAQKKRENRNVDPLCLTKHEEEKLDRVSSMVATLEVMETEVSKMVQQLEEIEEEDQNCKQQPPRHSENESEGALMLNDGEAKVTSEEEGNKDAPQGVDTPKAVLGQEEEVAHSDTNKITSDDPSETSQLLLSVDDLQKKEQREQQKMAIVEAILLCLQQTQPLRDNIAQLTKSLYIFRADTAADKIVCEVSGNFMSSRDAEERIAAHYAGKQYVGWKAVRAKLAELEKKFRGRPPPRQPPLLPHEREMYKRDMERGLIVEGREGFGAPGYNGDPRGRGSDRRGRGGGNDAYHSGGRYGDNRSGVGYHDDYRSRRPYEGRGGGAYDDRGRGGYGGRDGHWRR